MFAGIEYVIAPVALGERGDRAASRTRSGRRPDNRLQTIPHSQHLIRLEGRELTEVPKVFSRCPSNPCLAVDRQSALGGSASRRAGCVAGHANMSRMSRHAFLASFVA